MNKAVDEVRSEETRQMRQQGLEPVLKKSRWLLLKRQENLKDEQRFRLRDLVRYNLKTVRAYLLKEAFSNSGITNRRPGPASSSIYVAILLMWPRSVVTRSSLSVDSGYAT